MRAVSDLSKFPVAGQASYGPDLTCPNPRGWYHSVANVVNTPAGLVAVYRLSDSHTAVATHIMVAFSRDRGRSWFGHRSISSRNVWEHNAVWIAPQLSRLSDGRLVVICDLGRRLPGEDWPRLAHWQRQGRGMANYLFWSDDDGQNWSQPVKCDDVGGEPGYIVELCDGTLVYTRTESVEAASFENPPPPEHRIYCRNVAVFSDDRGQTWDRTAVVSDDPYHGDAEVGIVELEPGHLLAVTRIGYGNGDYGQPSRFIHSFDAGRTWGQPRLAPFYGQRTAVHRLRSGKLLVTYRNRWGTFASYAFAWDPSEELGFEPASFIWDESRCKLARGELVLSTDRGDENKVFFSLYPALTGEARVEMEAEVRLAGAKSEGCDLFAGCHLRLSAQGIRLVDGEDDDEVPTGAGPAPADTGRIGWRSKLSRLDTSKWHRYRVVRAGGEIVVFVDGRPLLRERADTYENRLVRFGSNLPSESHWRSVRATVENKHGHSIDWSWRAEEGGYPDQFRRDRMVLLDAAVDSGYSNWDQIEDGTIVVADYTNGAFYDAASRLGPQPHIRAYRISEEELI